MVIEVLCIIDGIVGCALGVAKIDVKFELHPQNMEKAEKRGQPRGGAHRGKVNIGSEEDIDEMHRRRCYFFGSITGGDRQDLYI